MVGHGEEWVSRVGAHYYFSITQFLSTKTIHYLLMQSNIAIYKHTEMFFKAANTTPIMAIMTRKLKLDVHMNIITAGGKHPTHEAIAHLMKYFIFKF